MLDYFTGMYVVATKSIGFNIEVTNNDASTVITGVRILLGSQDSGRVPSFIQVIFITTFELYNLLICLNYLGIWTDN